MSEISEDGFWQMVEGEWVPTEKQLEAIQNGAIRHDEETVQQKTGEPDHREIFTHQLVNITSESQYLGTKDYVSFVGYVLIVFGILDFLLSFMGTNITFFLGLGFGLGVSFGACFGFGASLGLFFAPGGLPFFLGCISSFPSSFS